MSCEQFRVDFLPLSRAIAKMFQQSGKTAVLELLGVEAELCSLKKPEFLKPFNHHWVPSEG